MKVILRFLRPHKRICIITIFLAFIDILGALIIPTYAAQMLNLGTMPNANFSLLLPVCIKMLIAALISGAAMIAASYFCADLTSKVAADMRNALYEKTMSLSGADFRTFGTAYVTTRTVSDIMNIQFVLGNCFQMLFPVPFIFVISLVFAFRIDSLLGLILLAVLALISVVCGFIMHSASPIFKKLQKKLDKMSKVSDDDTEAIADEYTIFGRVTPKQKKLLIAAMQKRASLPFNKLRGFLSAASVIGFVCAVVIFSELLQIPGLSFAGGVILPVVLTLGIILALSVKVPKSENP